VTGGGVRLRWHLRWLTAGWVMLVLVVMLSLAPGLDRRTPVAHLDKLEHALAYLVLMAWFGGLSRASLHRWIALALLALGLAIEALQGASGWRSAEPLDLAAGAVGIALGWWLACAPVPRWFHHLERRLGA